MKRKIKGMEEFDWEKGSGLDRGIESR